jgi:hypothetical protein
MYRLRKITGLLLLMATIASTVSAGSLSFAGDEVLGELRWKTGSIKIALSVSLLRENSNIKRDSDVTGALRRSLDAWSRIADVDFQVVNSDKLGVSASGPAGDGVSLITIAQIPENVLLFAKDPENAAATTRVFYNRRGMITEADIVLNPYQQFSTDGTLGTFDLESTLTHEIGHLLGLRHSLVLGSTMNPNYGRNGVFGIRNFSPRTLSAGDVASIRGLYGSRGEEKCCGSVEGRILIAGRTAPRGQIWIEDVGGRVIGSTEIASDGGYNFAGLNSGKYRIYFQSTGKARNGSAAEMIGEAAVANDEVSVLNGRASTVGRDLDLSYLGLNGQLSDMAVHITPGRINTVYIGGRNLDPKRLSIRFTSPQLSTVSGSVRSLDYGEEISVVSFDIRVSRTIPAGEYTVLVESSGGDRRAFVGGLTVENSSDFTANLAAFDE